MLEERADEVAREPLRADDEHRPGRVVLQHARLSRGEREEREPVEGNAEAVQQEVLLVEGHARRALVEDLGRDVSDGDDDEAVSRHRRRHVYCAGMDAPVLKMTASARR